MGGKKVAVDSWKYEVGTKHKQAWNRDEPGFVQIDGHEVGKCPRGISIEHATELINAGIEWSPARWPNEYPKRIYVVWNGYVYRATPTTPGVSYHAFPELPAELRRLPSTLRKRILERADALRFGDQIRRWMNA